MIQNKRMKRLTMLMAYGLILFLSGCQDTKPRQAIDDTVETVTGQKTVDQMEKIKKDIEKIEKKQAERLKQFDE